MAIKSTIKGGMDGEHPHGTPRSAYAMKQTKDVADNIMGYDTGNVPPLMTMDGIKQTAINAANNGYVQASATGAIVGAAALGGLNLENPDAPIVNGPMSAAGAVAGAAIGAAGKFAKDTLKMSKK